MHISAKGNYGIKAVLDLALHEGRGYVQSADIASRQNIPESYLVSASKSATEGRYRAQRSRAEGGTRLGDASPRGLRRRGFWSRSRVRSTSWARRKAE